MNKKTNPSLIVLAAGMGSRYGGLKQMDAFGPNGETILDYSIYDAIRAGFGSVVFVIREHFRKDFETFFKGKFDNKIVVHFVTQELDKLPEGYEKPDSRQKPWGTAHAMMMAAERVDGPFAVINADDFYGAESYVTLADFLNNTHEDNNVFSVVGYNLKNTLSDHGEVNRGVCNKDDQNRLITVTERTKIRRNENGQIYFPNPDGTLSELSEDTTVSMNMWGFKNLMFGYLEDGFRQFLDKNIHTEKSEYYIPSAVDQLIKNKEVEVEVLSCDAKWFGVTYQEDKPIVMQKLKSLIEKGVYPEKLWT